MTAQTVPAAVFDIGAALAANAAELRALEAERGELAEQYVAAMSEMHQREDLPNLLNALRGFKVVHGTGWFKTAVMEAGLPDIKTLEADLRGWCNDGEGRWRGSWPLDPESLRPKKGKWVVYQLLLEDDLLYIGSTGDFATRLKAHSRDKAFDSWRAALCGSERECRDLETALIDRYRPPLNRMIPTPRVVLA